MRSKRIKITSLTIVNNIKEELQNIVIIFVIDTKYYGKTTLSSDI